MNITELIEIDKHYHLNTYGYRTKVSFDYGKGINLWDKENNKYYDFLSGIAVTALGHSHPKIVSSILEQATKILHCSNLYYIESQTKLAKLLVENSCADKVFFANSGAEANEGAIKLARKYFKDKGFSDKYEIITLKDSFHGRTLATLSATGQEKYQKNFTPLMPKFIHVERNNIEELNNKISKNTCAIMIEIIQGESGVHLLSKEYLSHIKKICNNNNILLIIDEIQTGLGRTGKLFGYQHFDVEPDIFTLAKALGNGIPISALCAKEFVASSFSIGDHGSTFGGNPFVCNVALSVIDVILTENISKNSELMGVYFIECLNHLKNKYNIILEIRGKGLMIAIEIKKNKAKEIKNLCFDEGFLIGSIGENILRLLPPLIIEKNDIDKFIEIFEKVLSKFD